MGQLFSTPGVEDEGVFNPTVARCADNEMRAAVEGVASLVERAQNVGLWQVAHYVELLARCHDVTGLYSGIPTVFRKGVHRQIYAFLSEHAQLLVTDGFRGRADVASRTLHGVKGCGKTVALRNFADVAPVAYGPCLIVLYVDCSVPSPLRLLERIYPALVAAGVPLRVKPQEVRAGHVSDALEACGKYLMLLVDEFECVFKETCDAAVGTVFDLIAFTSVPKGRVATILCGSSPSLMQLVTNKGREDPENLCVRFPLLLRAVSMNGTKFHAHMLTCSVATDMDAFDELAPGASLPDRRVLAFFAGSNNLRLFGKVREDARFLRARLKAGEPIDATAMERLEAILAPFSEQDAPLDSALRLDDFLRALFRAFISDNEELIRAAVDPNTQRIALNRIGELEWELFKPLSFRQVVEIHEAIPNRRPGTRALNDWRLLVDRGWFGERHNFLFPSRFLDVVAFALGSEGPPLRHDDDGFDVVLKILAGE